MHNPIQSNPCGDLTCPTFYCSCAVWVLASRSASPTVSCSVKRCSHHIPVPHLCSPLAFAACRVCSHCRYFRKLQYNINKCVAPTGRARDDKFPNRLFVRNVPGTALLNSEECALLEKKKKGANPPRVCSRIKTISFRTRQSPAIYWYW